MTMTKTEMKLLMEKVFNEEINKLRESGQAEYANSEDAFGNFNRLADELGISREKVLWTYAMKHKDGIVSWLNGNKSQREDVRGRINDLIVYLFLLRGMIEDASNANFNIT
jgi:soluble P-type ATPase